MSELGQKIGVGIRRRRVLAAGGAATIAIGAAAVPGVAFAQERYLPFGDSGNGSVDLRELGTSFNSGTVFGRGRVALGEYENVVFPFLTRIDREGVRQFREEVKGLAPIDTGINYFFTQFNHTWVQARTNTNEFLSRVGIDRLVEEGVLPRYEVFDLRNPSTLNEFGKSIETELLSWMIRSAELYREAGRTAGASLDFPDYKSVRRPENTLGVNIPRPIRVIPQPDFDYKAHYAKYLPYSRR